MTDSRFRDTLGNTLDRIVNQRDQGAGLVRENADSPRVPAVFPSNDRSFITCGFYYRRGGQTDATREREREESNTYSGNLADEREIGESPANSQKAISDRCGMAEQMRTGSAIPQRRYSIPRPLRGSIINAVGL